MQKKQEGGEMKEKDIYVLAYNFCDFQYFVKSSGGSFSQFIYIYSEKILLGVRDEQYIELDRAKLREDYEKIKRRLCVNNFEKLKEGEK